MDAGREDAAVDRRIRAQRLLHLGLRGGDLPAATCQPSSSRQARDAIGRVLVGWTSATSESLCCAATRRHRAETGRSRSVPADKDTAYRVARLVEEELGWQVAGWKIAAAKAEMQQALRTDSPIYGRVFAPGVHPHR